MQNIYMVRVSLGSIFLAGKALPNLSCYLLCHVLSSCQIVASLSHAKPFMLRWVMSCHHAIWVSHVKFCNLCYFVSSCPAIYVKSYQIHVCSPAMTCWIMSNCQVESHLDSCGHVSYCDKLGHVESGVRTYMIKVLK